MENCKLYYFNASGLAEPIRYLLHYCKVEFKDIRLSYEEWTTQYKNLMPMKQVPVLEIDGIKYHQHKAICRYIANKFNLIGSSNEEILEIDALVDDIDDIRLEIGNYYKEEDEKFKAILKEKMLQKLPFYLNKFEIKISTNDGKFCKGKITWADIYYVGISEIMSNILQKDINKDYLNLTKLTESIRNDARIKNYLDKRPTSYI